MAREAVAINHIIFMSCVVINQYYCRSINFIDTIHSFCVRKKGLLHIAILFAIYLLITRIRQRSSSRACSLLSGVTSLNVNSDKACHASVLRIIAPDCPC